jgi:hypothetical protein
MTRKYLFALTAALTLSIAAQVAAQGAKMTVRPDSKLTLAGSSNLHDWACNSSALNAAIALDDSYDTKPLTSIARPISTVVITIPVKSLKCGHGKMDDNMYKALKAEQYPEIKYVLDTYEIDRSKTTADSFAALTKGEITVAGQTKSVEIPITALRNAGGSMKGEGTLAMKMTDFGIKPPNALLGTLKTRDDITITFTVLLDKSTVVALSQR